MDITADQELDCYSAPSGINPKAIIAIPLIAIISLIGAFIYSFAVVYIPIVGFVNVAAMFFYAMLMGKTCTVMAKVFKDRSLLSLFVVGGMSGLLALYFVWATFVFAFGMQNDVPFDFVGLLLAPADLWEVICAIGEDGWYSVGGGTPSGFVLWAFWIAEALVIVFAPILLSVGNIVDKVLCVPCNNWAEEDDGLVMFAPPADEAVVEALLNQDRSCLDHMYAADGRDGVYFRLDARHCSQCQDLYTMSLQLTTITIDKDGKPDTKDESIVEHQLISESFFNELKNYTLPERPEIEREEQQEEHLEEDNAHFHENEED